MTATLNIDAELDRLAKARNRAKSDAKIFAPVGGVAQGRLLGRLAGIDKQEQFMLQQKSAGDAEVSQDAFDGFLKREIIQTYEALAMHHHANTRRLEGKIDSAQNLHLNKLRKSAKTAKRDDRESILRLADEYEQTYRAEKQCRAIEARIIALGGVPPVPTITTAAKTDRRVLPAPARD